MMYTSIVSFSSVVYITLFVLSNIAYVRCVVDVRWALHPPTQPSPVLRTPALRSSKLVSNIPQLCVDTDSFFD